ncbi:MAG: VCBS repeat-containing protein [Ignavibacteriota bacterium]
MLFIYAALGNGDGSFHTPALFYAPYGSGLVVTDFDQDGLDDIAAVSLIGVETLMGTRDGLMRLVGFTGLPDYANDLLAQGDFNGDGKIDLAAGFQGGEIAGLTG